MSGTPTAGTVHQWKGVYGSYIGEWKGVYGINMVNFQERGVGYQYGE